MTLGRRGRTALAVAAAIVGSLVLGAGLWWCSYTRSPAYSLAQLTRAVQAGDWQGFQRYVDVESVVGGLVDAAVDDALGGDGSALGGAVGEFAGAAKPLLVAQAESKLRDAIEGRASAGPLADAVAPYLVAASVRSVVYEGSDAFVTVAVPVREATIEVRLRMRRVDDHWSVTAIDDPEDIGAFLDLPSLLSE